MDGRAIRALREVAVKRQGRLGGQGVTASWPKVVDGEVKNAPE